MIPNSEKEKDKTEIEKTANKIAQAIGRAHFNAGEYSGFSYDGLQQIEKLLVEFAEKIKKEIHSEIKSPPA